MLIALAIKRAVARTLEKIGRAVAAMVGIGAEAWLVVRAVSSSLSSSSAFFPHMVEDRLYDPSEIYARDSAKQFLEVRICSVSTTFGINWSIFDVAGTESPLGHRRKNTVGTNGEIQ